MSKQAKHHTPYRLTPTTQLVLASLLFLISLVASRGADMTAGEISLFNWVYGWPDFLHPFFFFVTQAGTVYAFGLLLLLILAKKRFDILTRVLMGGMLAYLASGFAKGLWGRTRPLEVLADVINRDYAVWGPGFPSGHTALATVLALTIGHFLPKKYKWVTVAVILLVGVSRIYLGVHAPLDIVGGIAIGWMSYALLRHVRIGKLGTRLYTKKAPDKPLQRKRSISSKN